MARGVWRGRWETQGWFRGNVEPVARCEVGSRVVQMGLVLCTRRFTSGGTGKVEVERELKRLIDEGMLHRCLKS